MFKLEVKRKEVSVQVRGKKKGSEWPLVMLEVKRKEVSGHVRGKKKGGEWSS